MKQHCEKNQKNKLLTYLLHRFCSPSKFCCFPLQGRTTTKIFLSHLTIMPLTVQLFTFLCITFPFTAVFAGFINVWHFNLVLSLSGRQVFLTLSPCDSFWHWHIVLLTSAVLMPGIHASGSHNNNDCVICAVRSAGSSYAAMRMVVGSLPVLLIAWEWHIGLALLCGCSGALEYLTTNSCRPINESLSLSIFRTWKSVW